MDAEPTTPGSSASGPSAPARRSSRRRRLAIGAGLLAFVVWWWWPTLMRDQDRVDVLVVGGGQVGEARQPIERRIRESGKSVEILDAADGLCAVVDEVGDRVRDDHPSVVVISPGAAERCADGRDGWVTVRDAAGTERTVVLVQPGVTDAGTISAVTAADVTVADPTRLLGAEQSAARLPCQWWDDCAADGAVEVRSSDGQLTAAGGERLARVLVAVIP